MAETVVEDTGFCESCSFASLTERYHEHRAAEVEARRRNWREWDRERQRQHRLLAKVRPVEPAPPETDPLELGFAILGLLAANALQRGPGATPRGGGAGASTRVGTGANP